MLLKQKLRFMMQLRTYHRETVMTKSNWKFLVNCSNKTSSVCTQILRSVAKIFVAMYGGQTNDVFILYSNKYLYLSFAHSRLLLVATSLLLEHQIL